MPAWVAGLLSWLAKWTVSKVWSAIEKKLAERKARKEAEDAAKAGGTDGAGI